MKKTELVGILNSYLTTPAEEQINVWMRRFFRCYLDGSYLGQDSYVSWRTEYRKFTTKKQKRSFIIQRFVEFIKVEFSLSESSIRKTIVECLKDILEEFNNELIDDADDIYLDR